MQLKTAGKANKYAAMALLMKCYLNKAVYTNRTNPVPALADMNMVISLADSIIKSGAFSLSKNYFDNFAPNTGDPTVATENIFAQLPSSTGNNKTATAWIDVIERAEYPIYVGANGFTTLSEFYSRFDSGDKRSGIAYTYPSSFPNLEKRVNVGFLVGQQYDLTSNDSLSDYGFWLNYTPGVQNIDTGSNVLMPGIRPLKYAPDFSNYFNPNNNFVYLRFADVLLMKAEAILRGGTGTPAGIYGDNATLIVNAIRTDSSRGAPPISLVTPDSLFDERGRELWWEGWRRQDMIRFRKFLKPFQEKEYQSDPKYLLFPIPYDQVLLDSNYKQNHGY
jgi:hypothetical protein